MLFFFNYILYLFIAGSINQSHQLFYEFLGLLDVQSRVVSQWSTSTVDQILTEGDSMCLNSLWKKIHSRYRDVVADLSA